MSRVLWDQAITSKRFYVTLYRRSINLLLISLVLNGLLSYLALHLFLKRPPRVPYSTDGASPPVLLSAMTAPNKSSTPLLASDPVEPRAEKQIPQ